MGDGGGEGSSCGSAVILFEDILAVVLSSDGRLEGNKRRIREQEGLGMVTRDCDPKLRLRHTFAVALSLNAQLVQVPTPSDSWVLLNRMNEVSR